GRGPLGGGEPLRAALHAAGRDAPQRGGRGGGGPARGGPLGPRRGGGPDRDAGGGDGAPRVRPGRHPRRRRGRGDPAVLPLRVGGRARPRHSLRHPPRHRTRCGRPRRWHGGGRARPPRPPPRGMPPEGPPRGTRVDPSGVQGGSMDDNRLLHDPPLSSLEEYMAVGGGNGLAGARHVGSKATIEEITAAGLRGRGGAGFPTGVKWRSVVSGASGTRYAVCNAAEGEPGTFKDRALLRANPYAVIEGLLIAAETVGATEAFLAMKASFTPELEAVRRALTEIEEADWLGGITITVVTGPEEYLFGEEKALLEVIEGKEPLPRWLPPYLHALFSTGPQLGWQAAPSPDPAALPADGA